MQTFGQLVFAWLDYLAGDCYQRWKGVGSLRPKKITLLLSLPTQMAVRFDCRLALCCQVCRFGLAAGAAVVNPVGVLDGGTVGVVAGVIGSSGAGELAKPENKISVDDTPKDGEGTNRGITPR